MIYFVATPIGNLEDISKRAVLALKEAEIIFCEDTRVTKKLLNLLQIPLNKNFISMHAHNENKVIASLKVEELKEKKVVYVSDAGMPGISDPGSRLIQFAQKNNIPYTIIPGPSAFLVALVASGFEGEFAFYGFLPKKGKKREKKLNEIINSNTISIIYEAPHRIERLIGELKEKIPDREIFLAKELTKLHEKFIKSKAKDIKIDNPKGEWVVVIDKNKNANTINLKYEDILNLDISKKEKARLLAKITNKSSKEIYKQLIGSKC